MKVSSRLSAEVRSNSSLKLVLIETSPFDQPDGFFPFLELFCTVAWNRPTRLVAPAEKNWSKSDLCWASFGGFVGRETGENVLACAADLLFIKRVLLSQELLCNSFDGVRVDYLVADMFVKVWRVGTFLSFYLLIPPPLLCESGKATYLMSC